MASNRIFEVAQLVLIYISAEGEPLKPKLHGSYEIFQKLSPVNYLINTPDRRKKTLIYHINFIRPFHTRDNRFDNDFVPTVLFVTYINSPIVEIKDHDDLISTISHYQLPDIDIELRGNPNDDFSPEWPPELTVIQQAELNSLLTEFKELGLFSNSSGLTNLGTHKILVKPDIKPFKCTPYRMHPDKIKILRKEIDTLLELGIIRPSQSSYASPCMLIDKPDEGVRLVIDYSLLNKNCYCQAHPIPRIDDLIDKVGQAKFLTKLDLTKAYWNILLDEESIQYTGFVTSDYRFFEWLRLPFGISAACSTFKFYCVAAFEKFAIHSRIF